VLPGSVLNGARTFLEQRFVKNTDRDHPVDDERNIIMSSRTMRTLNAAIVTDDGMTSRA
jgi:hypothetical protein